MSDLAVLAEASSCGVLGPVEPPDLAQERRPRAGVGVGGVPHKDMLQ